MGFISLASFSLQTPNIHDLFMSGHLDQTVINRTQSHKTNNVLHVCTYKHFGLYATKSDTSQLVTLNISVLQVTRSNMSFIGCYSWMVRELCHSRRVLKISEICNCFLNTCPVSLDWKRQHLVIILIMVKWSTCVICIKINTAVENHAGHWSHIKKYNICQQEQWRSKLQAGKHGCEQCTIFKNPSEHLCVMNKANAFNVLVRVAHNELWS